ncbi:MAG: phage integrase N-terminal SAM-like domain-containing protein [Clostridia bacterium]|nr:phage integrase N-terminal SAM-like domain-containing protein [Clostridia bacterium]
MSQKEKERTRAFAAWMRGQERAEATIEQYGRQVRRLYAFLNGRPISKELVLAYRQRLLEKGYKPQTVNGALSAIHKYLRSVGREDCMVQMVRVQRSAFVDDSRELGQEEYRRLLAAARAKKNQRLYFVLQTLCSTGIRVSELRYVTVEAAPRWHSRASGG